MDHTEEKDMRDIIINRPKRMECCASTLKIEVNGVNVAKIKNNQRVVVQAEIGPVTLRVHGGLLQGKSFQDTVKLPEGQESYEFQVDFISTSNSYVPLLRPCKGEFVKDDTRLICLLGATFSRVLLDEKVRGALKKLPGACLKLVVEQSQWKVLICQAAAAKEVYHGEYSRAVGGIGAAVINLAENMDLKTPEGRAKVCDKVLTDYACLPGYERLGADCLVFKG